MIPFNNPNKTLRCGILVAVVIALCWTSIVPPTTAQEALSPQITAQNVEQLASIYTIDFDSLPAGIVPTSGQFSSDDSGHVLLTFGASADNATPFSQVLWWEDGELIGTFEIEGDSVVRYLHPTLPCLYAGYAGAFRVYEFGVTNQQVDLLEEVFLASHNDAAVNFWNVSETSCTDQYWVEVSAETTIQVLEVTDSEVTLQHADALVMEEGDAAARVGRIQPPLAFTIDFDGNLYQWDMSTNEINYAVDVGEIAMFGKSNFDGTHYLWLNAANDGLYLADFSDETFRQVALLDGVYISHLLLGHDADVAIGVDPFDNRGTVSAWNIDSGERFELGDYRACERTQPDLVRLTDDGSTIIIGCDLGIDVWRIVDNS